MLPGTYNITIVRGGTFEVSFEATDDLGPIDFSATYASARLQVRKPWNTVPMSKNIGLPLTEWTTENGKLTLTSTSVDVSVSAEETAAYTFNSGVYELELVTDDIVPKVDKLLLGSFNVTGEATV